MRLLLAEDNRELAHWLEKALVQGGFAVDCVFDGRAADHLLQSEKYALAVLDIGMPGFDGLEVVQRLRKRGQTLPVLLLTARSAVADRVKGLNVGADDYLPKPFELEELDARLRALLRRSEGQVHEIQQIGSLEYRDEGYFLLRGQTLSLTPREQALLTVLMFRRTRPVSRQQLNADCDRHTASAARLKLPYSTSATKLRSWRKSRCISPPHSLFYSSKVLEGSLAAQWRDDEDLSP